MVNLPWLRELCVFQEGWAESLKSPWEVGSSDSGRSNVDVHLLAASL